MQPSETKAQHDTLNPSYANTLKKNINKKPPKNSDTKHTSERPTLHQQLKSLKEKQIRRNRSRSPSTQQSKPNISNQLRDQEILALKSETEN